MWETFNRVLTGKYVAPYDSHESKTDVHFINSIQRGARPQIPPRCPLEIRELVEHCWQDNPDARPSLGELCNFLSQQYTNMKL